MPLSADFPKPNPDQVTQELKKIEEATFIKETEVRREGYKHIEEYEDAHGRRKISHSLENKHPLNINNQKSEIKKEGELSAMLLSAMSGACLQDKHIVEMASKAGNYGSLRQVWDHNPALFSIQSDNNDLFKIVKEDLQDLERLSNIPLYLQYFDTGSTNEKIQHIKNIHERLKEETGMHGRIISKTVNTQDIEILHYFKKLIILNKLEKIIKYFNRPNNG